MPIDSAVTITIDATDSNGNQTPDFKESITGVVNTGSSSLVTCIRGVDGTTVQSHSAGASVVQWFTANDWNDFITSYLTNHTQLGGHTSLLDTNGANWIGQIATPNAVNYLNVANSISGGDVVISTSGGDTSPGIDLVPKGGGPVKLLNALYNPYKFYYYHNTSQTITSTFAPINFNSKLFDTSSNVASSTFTVPISGFYWFSGRWSNQGSASLMDIALFKNGSLYSLGGTGSIGGSGDLNNYAAVCYQGMVQCTIGDSVTLNGKANGTVTALGGTQDVSYFQGILLCAT